MELSPYKKLCLYFLGSLPENSRGKPKKGKATAKDLANCIGIRHETVLRWRLIPGTSERVIPAGSAKMIERLSDGEVTAEEIASFASKHQRGEAA